MRHSPVLGLAGPAPAAAQRAPAGSSVAGSATMLLVALLAIALAYFALLDGWYLVRVPCAVLRARLLLPRVRDLLAEQRYANRVLPSDLDLLLHMNNARYLREADVAYVSHQARCGVLGALPALGASAVLGASCVRYRRSLRLLEPFEVRTRLLGWDDRAFYLEARFISLRDGFVCALLRARHHVLGTSPERVVQHLCKRRVSAPAPGAPPLPWGRPTALGCPCPAAYRSSPLLWVQGPHRRCCSWKLLGSQINSPYLGSACPPPATPYPGPSGLHAPLMLSRHGSPDEPTPRSPSPVCLGPVKPPSLVLGSEHIVHGSGVTVKGGRWDFAA